MLKSKAFIVVLTEPLPYSTINLQSMQDVGLVGHKFSF